MLHPLVQKYPMTSLFFVKTSHAGQWHPVVFTCDEVDVLPRAQNSAPGGDPARLLRLNVGQDPQYFMQISRFSEESSTVLASFTVFMVTFTTK